MAVQELHGIFQFADDLFPAAAAEEVPILASYQAKAVFPKWFQDVELVDGTGDEEETIKASYAVKYKLDLLYYEGRYEEACAVGLGILAHGHSRRETYEAVLLSAVRAGQRELAWKMLGHLEALNVEDAGLAHVLDRARRDLQIDSRMG